MTDEERLEELEIRRDRLGKAIDELDKLKDNVSRMKETHYLLLREISALKKRIAVEKGITGAQEETE